MDGAGCGACGLGFAIPAPGRLGRPSGPTTRVCLQWLDEGVERRRRKPHGHVGVMPPGPSPEVRLRGAKTPPVERREACALIAKRAAPQGARLRRLRLSALRSLTCVRDKGKEGANPAPHHERGR